MADRSIVVRLRAEAAGFKAEMAAAAEAARKVGKDTDESAKSADTAMGRMVQSATRNREAWTTAGTVLTGFGAATLGGLGLATKAAMDWESAWTGVTKTIDGTAEQYAALESQLRGLATTLPSSHQEIAAVAEAAGQLGVRREDIASFTKTMIDLGQTTNLSADEAATAIAQFANVMGTSTSDAGRLGAALVALGNAGASTERDIMMMAQRLSSTGAMIGASEQDILGLSSALADVGISAEAGGGALSRVLQDMNTAVLSGGDALAGFADVAGVSAEEFASKWRSSPVEALALFETGLQGITASGGNAVGTLSDLGIKSTEETRALLSLAANADGLSASLATANDGWAEGTALVAEAAKYYETAEAKIAIARNQLVDFGIDIGGVLLPAVASFAGQAGDFITWFEELPGPVKEAGVALAGIAGAASLGIGGFLLVVPRIIEGVAAFKALAVAADGSTTAFGKISGALGKLAVGGAVLTGLIALGDSMRDYTMGAEEAAAATTNLASSASPMNDVFKGMFPEDAPLQAGEMASGLDRLANGPWWGKLQDAGTNLLNTVGDFGPTFEDQRARLAQFGEQLAGLAEVDLPQAQAAFKALWTEAGGTDEVGLNLLKTMPAFRDQLVAVANAAKLPTDDLTLLKIANGELATGIAATDDALGSVTTNLEAAGQAASDAVDSMVELGNVFLDSRDAALDYADSLDDASKLIEENGKHWGDGTQAARDQERALNDVGRAALGNLEAMKANGEKTSGFMQQARDEIIRTGMAFGMSQADAEAYADSLQLTPTAIATQVRLEDTEALARLDAYQQKFGNVPELVLTDVGIQERLSPESGGTLDGYISEMVSLDGMSATTSVSADTSAAVVELDSFRVNLAGTTGQIYITADSGPAQQALSDLEGAVDSAGGSITINGKSQNAQFALQTLMEQVEGSNGTVTINGQSVPANQALNALIGQVNAGAGTITIKGNTGPADQATNAAVGKADSATGTIRVGANTSAAEGQIGYASRDRYATIHVNTVISGAGAVAAAALRRASGGPVFGPGTATSDSIPARLSNGEHVFTAREVQLAGGHDAVFRMREAIRAGALRFAGGGGVDGFRAVRMAPMAAPHLNAGALLDRGATPASLQVTNNFNEVGGEAAEIAAWRVQSRIQRSLIGVTR